MGTDNKDNNGSLNKKADALQNKVDPLKKETGKVIKFGEGQQTSSAPIHGPRGVLGDDDGDKKGMSTAAKVTIAAAVTAVVTAGAVAGVMTFRDDDNKIVYTVDGQEIEIELDGGSTAISLQKPQVPGYNFGGWYLDEALTQELADDYVFTKDTVIYPKFVPKTCKVEYFANDGTGQAMFQEVVYKTDYKLMASPYERENYIFVGWSEDPEAHYTDEDIVKPNKKRTLFTEGFKYYAIWKGENRKITFSASELRVNGDAYTFTKTNCPYGEKFELPAIDGVVTNATDDTMKFAGYIINGEVFSVGDEITITEDTTISINWEERDSILYFNLNLPAGEETSALEPLSFTTKQDEYVYMHLPTPGELVNYEFVCWNTELDGSGTDYLAPDSFTTTEQSNVLYAIWVGKVRTINIYNKGELTETINTRYGETVELETYTLANHTFVGFNDKSDYTGNIYNGSIDVNFTDSVLNLYAEYTRNTTTLSFDLNGGDGEIEQITVNTNEVYTFKQSEITHQKESLTKKYYILAGWSTDKNAKPADASFSINVQEASITLYAIWVGEARTINFYSDGKLANMKKTKYGEKITLPTFTMSNHTFVGFNDKSDFTGNTYTGEIEVLFKDAEINLYAEYTRNKATISFDINGGEGSLLNVELNTNEKYTFTESEISAHRKALSKKNYEFVGWSTNKEATADQANFTVDVGEEAITLYAIWLGEARNINLYNNGTLITTIETRYGRSIELPTYVLENHTFVAFNDEIDFSGERYNGSIEVLFETANVNLYAEYTRNKATISFDANGGSGNLSAVELNTNEVYTFKPSEVANQKATLTKENYILAGFSTNKNADPDTVNFTVEVGEEAITLYAIWVGEAKTINLYSQGTFVEEIETRYGEKLTLPTYTLANHTFVGFNNAADFTGERYTGEFDILFEDEVLNLYAEYTRNKTTISFNANGGEGSLSTIEVNTNETYIFKQSEIASIKEALTKEYYELVGFSTNKNATAAEASFTIDVKEATVKLYAIWKGEARSINLYSQGVLVETLHTNYGESLTLPAYTLENHAFVGFNDKSDFSGTSYVGSFKVEFVATTLDLYAEFSRDKVMIVFDANGGEGTYSALEVNTNETYIFKQSEITALKSAITKTNFELVGFSTNKNATEGEATFNVTIQNSSVTLYAIWVGAARAINLYNNGVLVETINARYGDSIKLPAYTLANHTFKYFNDKSDFTGSTYRGDIDVLFETQIVNLYAEYDRNKTTVSFDANGGSGSYASMSVNTNEVYVFSENEIKELKSKLVKENYELVGFSTNKNAATADANFTVSVGETGLTLYAVWIGATRTINLYNNGELLKTIETRYGEVVVLETPTLENHTFIGFNEKENFTGRSYSGIVNIAFTDAVVNLYAEFARNEVAISFDANGGAGGVEMCVVNTNEIYTFSESQQETHASELSRQYYTFVGWSTNPDARPEDATFTVDVGEEPITLYAVWQQKTTQITFACDDNSGNTEMPPTLTLNQGTYYTFTNNGFSRLGYYIEKFICNDREYVLGDTILLETEEINIEVIWAIESLLYFNLDVGSVELFETGEEVKLEDIQSNFTYKMPNAPLKERTIEKDGTTRYFAGWATGPNVTYVQHYVGESVIAPAGRPDIYFPIYLEATSGLTYELDETGTFYSVSLDSQTEVTLVHNTLVIPSIYNGKPVNVVKSINCPSALRVVIAEGVDALEAEAFKSSKLENALIPSSVITIGNNCFADSVDLKYVTFSYDSSTSYTSGLTSICSGAFYNTKLLEIKIPAQVQIIDTEAFYGCNSATRIVFAGKSKVRTIGKGAFSYCTKVTSITIPASVTDIGESAFQNCGLLADVTFAANSQLISIGDYCFEGTAIKTITIPASVEVIGKSAFCYVGLSTVNFEANSNLETIDDGAFQNSGITEINIPATVTSIGNNCFNECSSLKTVTFESGSQLQTIGEGAFCSAGITEINIPATVTTISSNAFAESSLLSVTFAQNSKLETLESGAFAYTGITSITIPANLKLLKGSVFESSSLTTVDFESGSQLQNISANAFTGLAITSIAIPASVTQIGDSVFEDCSALKTVTFGENSLLSSMGYRAFANSGITSIEIPENVPYIYTECFYNCKSLTNVTFAENSILEGIYQEAFYGSGAIASMVLPSNLRTISENAFENSAIQEITIPAMTNSIRNYAFKGCEGLRTVNFESGSRLYEICCGVFEGATRLNNVVIPKSVQDIKEAAFYGCSHLVELDFEGDSQLVSIRSHAFANSSVNTFYVPMKLKTVGDYAFQNTNLQDIAMPTLGGSLETIGISAFENARYLTSVYFPATVKSIYGGAFAGCTRLRSVGFAQGSQLECIETNTFKGTNISEIIIPASIKGIFNNAFSQCTGLKTIHFEAGSNLIVIEAGAFTGAPITEVYMNDATPPQFFATVDFASVTTIYIPTGSIDTYKSARPEYESKYKEY